MNSPEQEIKSKITANRLQFYGMIVCVCGKIVAVDGVHCQAVQHSQAVVLCPENEYQFIQMKGYAGAIR